MRPYPFAALVAGAVLALLPGRTLMAQEPDELPIIEKPDFSKPPPPKPDEPPSPDGGPNAYIRTPDEVIAFFQERTRRVPADFISYRYLGEAYERKARELDDLPSYEKAEQAFRKAIELLPNYSRAEAGLAAVLCSRHKFAEGLEIAKKLHAREPKNLDALATIGDAQLELGRYEEAEATFAALYKLAPIPEVVARQANLVETKGDVDRAMTLMQQAAEAARKKGTAQDTVWYRVRMADMSFQDGKLAEAEKLYLDALKDVPKDVPKQHDATYGLSRIRGTQGRLDEAIELGKKAVAIGPDPHMLATLGDLYIKTGKPEKAKPLFDRLLKITEGKNEYLRIRAMFLADHDRNLPQALALAQKDFADRKDVYGYDALAWTLHKNGQHHEAAKAIDAALKIGVKDANVDFHAGMIRLKQGDRDGAREALKKALARNPQFSPIHADAARKTLAELGDGAAKVER